MPRKPAAFIEEREGPAFAQLAAGRPSTRESLDEPARATRQPTRSHLGRESLRGASEEETCGGRGQMGHAGDMVQACKRTYTPQRPQRQVVRMQIRPALAPATPATLSAAAGARPLSGCGHATSSLAHTRTRITNPTPAATAATPRCTSSRLLLALALHTSEVRDGLAPATAERAATLRVASMAAGRVGL